MKIGIDSKVLEDAVKTITKLAPSANGLVTLELNKRLVIHSAGELNRGKINVETTSIEGTGSFAISVDALTSATRGRKDLLLSYENSMLGIKSGRYKAQLSTFDPMNEEEKVAGKIKGTSIDTGTAGWLKEATRNVALAPDNLIMTYMPLGVKATSKGINVCCFDTAHVAVSGSGKVKGDFEFALPVNIFQNVLDVYAVSGFNMELTESSLRCSNAQLQVELALPVLDDTLPDVDTVLSMTKTSKNSDLVKLEVKKEELTNFFQNARAIAGKERTEVKMTVKSNRLQLTSSNINGSVTSVCKVKSKDLQVNVNLSFLEEAVVKAGPTVELGISEELIVCTTPSVIFVIGTNQG